MPPFPEVQQLQGDGVSLGVQGGDGWREHGMLAGASGRVGDQWCGVGPSGGFRSFEMVTL